MRKILLIEYFKNKYVARDMEVIDAIQMNQKSNVFDEILIVCEKNLPSFVGDGDVHREHKRFLLKQKINLKSNRRKGKTHQEKRNFTYKKNSIRYVLSEERQTFKSMFTYANKHYPDSIVVIANNDIYFDDSLSLLDDYNMTKKCFSLLRYDVLPNKKDSKIFEYYDHELARGYGSKGPRADAQDSWIFKTPISVPIQSNFYFGILGCDNHITYLLYKEGYKVINPALDIKSHHLHLTGIRNYDQNQRIRPPWLYIKPTTLHEVGKYKLVKP